MIDCNLVNLTSHDITIMTPSGNVVIKIPPARKAARIAHIETDLKPTLNVEGHAIPLAHIDGMHIENMPAYVPGSDTYYIVSRLVLDFFSTLTWDEGYRNDLISPDTGKSCLKDVDNKFIAITQFIRINP